MPLGRNADFPFASQQALMASEKPIRTVHDQPGLATSTAESPQAPPAGSRTKPAAGVGPLPGRREGRPASPTGFDDRSIGSVSEGLAPGRGRPVERDSVSGALQRV